MSGKTPLLHEVLAVEQEIKANSERARTQAVDMFRSKRTHFTGLRRTFRPFTVDESVGEDGAERLEADTQLVTTVAEQLQELFRAVGKSIDMGMRIDEANTQARADIVVEGQVLLSDVPATSLLQLEKRLRELRSVLKEVPTFDPVRIWSEDPGANKPYTLRAEAVTTIRKQRTRKYNVMVEATKEHPAQVDVVEVEVPVGEIKSYEWTGLISPGKKSALLDRLEDLISAVKQARSRANAVEVGEHEISKVITDYLLKPIL